jgi:GTP-binding protein
MDLVEASTFKKIESDAQDRLTFAPWAPITFLSARTGKGVGALLDRIIDVRDSFHKRVGTGELNRFFESVLGTHPPPTQGGRAPRLYYITQAETAPPLFVIMASSPESVHFSYQRYVTNQLRKHFNFDGTPVKVAYRERRRSPRKFGNRPERH